MKRQWSIKRHLSESADGQKRWDQAYQLLLKAARLDGEAAVGAVPVSGQMISHQEQSHEDSALRTSFNAAPGSDSEY